MVAAGLRNFPFVGHEDAGANIAALLEAIQLIAARPPTLLP
jgi:hypothetical protein